MIVEANLLTSISSTASTPTTVNASVAKKTKISAPPAADRSTVPKHAISYPHQPYVDHSYTDYACVDDNDLRLMKENIRSGGAETKAETTITNTLLGMSCSYGPMKSKGHGGSVMMPFPGKVSVHMMCCSISLTTLTCCIIHDHDHAFTHPYLLSNITAP